MVKVLNFLSRIFIHHFQHGGSGHGSNHSGSHTSGSDHTPIDSPHVTPADSGVDVNIGHHNGDSDGGDIVVDEGMIHPGTVVFCYDSA